MIILTLCCGCEDQKILSRSKVLLIELQNNQELNNDHKKQIKEFSKYYRIYEKKCSFIVLMTDSVHIHPIVIQKRQKNIHQIFINQGIPKDKINIVACYGIKSCVNIFMKFIDQIDDLK